MDNQYITMRAIMFYFLIFTMQLEDTLHVIGNMELQHKMSALSSRTAFHVIDLNPYPYGMTFCTVYTVSANEVGRAEKHTT